MNWFAAGYSFMRMPLFYNEQCPTETIRLSCLCDVFEVCAVQVLPQRPYRSGPIWRPAQHRWLRGGEEWSVLWCKLAMPRPGKHVVGTAQLRAAFYSNFCCILYLLEDHPITHASRAIILAHAVSLIYKCLINYNIKEQRRRRAVTWAVEIWPWLASRRLPTLKSGMYAGSLI